jgi:hypothetical protein
MAMSHPTARRRSDLDSRLYPTAMTQRSWFKLVISPQRRCAATKSVKAWLTTTTRRRNDLDSRHYVTTTAPRRDEPMKVSVAS